MLRFDQLSYWEREQYLVGNTFVIVGAGLVGMSTALSLHERFPNEKITVLERAYLPTGASTKNAGFTCFGSPSELQDDLQHIPAEKVWQTIELRLSGLELLRKRIGAPAMHYRNCGSWDLIGTQEPPIDSGFIAELNAQFKMRFDLDEVYQEDPHFQQKFGFNGYQAAYFNRHEGSIDTGKMIAQLYQQCVAAGIQFLFATEVIQWMASANDVIVETTHGELTAQHLFLCTNGFAQAHFPDELRPARAQVLVTKPLAHRIKGTFHSDRGYYYFRDVGQRILLGGGRHLDFQTETSTAFEKNERIRAALLHKLKEEILPGQAFEIDYEWSGIMCVGAEKKPIIRSLNKNVHAGVRMGGMGVAIGSAVGAALSKLV
ncbi:MAG: FAD-binding oxidoreductase [Crocinitomicaceae bacterium]|nr:FAD-binding oxidoreductase [Crocinitomicaceae bacterium]MDP5042580.1 FAD-binding oxidoreductase [Crocinitomicaceae bacterium]